jgi:uncharacterized protein
MQYYALIYYLVPDYLSQRSPYREEHLRLAGEANKHGHLILAGAFSEPVDQALLIFRVADASSIERFARNDPYVINGLVSRWEIRNWNVVIGGEKQE